jgi:hypothetical protein
MVACGQCTALDLLELQRTWRQAPAGIGLAGVARLNRPQAADPGADKPAHPSRAHETPASIPADRCGPARPVGLRADRRRVRRGGGGAARSRRQGGGGDACRHAGRAIEDCYTLNKRVDKAAVFAGWREMNDYMRENKIDTVVPQATPAPSETAAKADVPGAADEAPTKAAAKVRKGDKGDKGDKAEATVPAKADKAPAKHES